jgi:hypothetical protein
MNAGARRVQRVYLALLLLHALAASFIWGINTLFLLDDSGPAMSESGGENQTFASWNQIALLLSHLHALRSTGSITISAYWTEEAGPQPDSLSLRKLSVEA